MEEYNKIDEQEKLKKEFIKSTEKLETFQAVKGAQEDFPQSIYLGTKKKGGKVKIEDYQRLIKFLIFERKTLAKKDFVHLFQDPRGKGSKKSKLYPRGNGYLIPLPKQYDIVVYCLAINNIIGELKMELYAEKSTHHVCQSGSNIEVEFIYPVPGITTPVAKKLLEDFGVIEYIHQTEVGFKGAYSDLNHVLPKAQILFGSKDKQGWIPLNPALSISFRFTSRKTCRTCGEKGHDCSRCPTGFASKAAELRRHFPRQRPGTGRDKKKKTNGDNTTSEESATKGDSRILGLRPEDNMSFDSSSIMFSPVKKNVTLDANSSNPGQGDTAERQDTSFPPTGIDDTRHTRFEKEEMKPEDHNPTVVATRTATADLVNISQDKSNEATSRQGSNNYGGLRKSFLGNK